MFVLKKYLILPVTLLYLFVGAQQKTDSLFNIAATQNITDYKKLNKLFWTISKDSVQLKYLAHLSEKNNYPTGQIFAYTMLGKLNRVVANYPKAIYYHQKAIDLADSTNNLYYKIYNLNMMGVVYRRMDAVKSALEYHNKALELAKKSGSDNKDIIHNIAISHNSIGNIYLLLERDDMALKHFLKALEIEKKYNNKLGLAINYHNIGSIYEKQGDFKSAFEFYKKSLNYNEQINSKLGRIICNTSIGNLYLKQNKFQEAIKIIQPSLDLAKQLGDAYYLADINVNLGKAYFFNNKYELAEEHLFKALEIALSKKIPSIARDTYKTLSEIKEKQGDYEQALSFQKKYIEKHDEILNEKNRQLVSDLIIKQIKLENKEKMEELGEQNLIVKKKLTRTKKSFYYSLLLLLLFIILGSIFYKQRQLNNDRRLMNLEQSLLRARMNPHFIFNSLNSLKIFIIQQKPKEAVTYLTTFAKLVRTILQSTLDKETTLKEEIETIKMYVAIENKRFSDEVQFTINIEEDLDLDNIKIPPLITQPFIENALWHGLSPKEGEKTLIVNIYSKEQKYLVVEIIDNGIGRQKAEEIKKARIFKRESVGISLSEERLKYFSKQTANNYSIEFVDLFDEKGNPAGTKVILEIPCKKI